MKDPTKNFSPTSDIKEIHNGYTKWLYRKKIIFKTGYKTILTMPRWWFLGYSRTEKQQKW